MSPRQVARKLFPQNGLRKFAEFDKRVIKLIYEVILTTFLRVKVMRAI